MLERHQVPLALNTILFESIKNVGVLFFSFSKIAITLEYIQNT